MFWPWKKNRDVFKAGKRFVRCNDCPHSRRFATKWRRSTSSKIVRAFKQISRSRSHNAFAPIPRAKRPPSCRPWRFNLHLHSLFNLTLNCGSSIRSSRTWSRCWSWRTLTRWSRFRHTLFRLRVPLGCVFSTTEFTDACSRKRHFINVG